MTVWKNFPVTFQLSPLSPSSPFSFSADPDRSQSFSILCLRKSYADHSFNYFLFQVGHTLILGLAIGYKFSTRTLIYLLQPCHMVTAIQVGTNFIALLLATSTELNSYARSRVLLHCQYLSLKEYLRCTFSQLQPRPPH